ncbi:hypothetical protein AOLI_G00283090 [Acnodon oligacanthus]
MSIAGFLLVSDLYAPLRVGSMASAANAGYSAARRRKVNTSLVHVFDTVVSVSDSDVTESSGSDKKISAVLTKHGCCNVNLNPPEET